MKRLHVSEAALAAVLLALAPVTANGVLIEGTCLGGPDSTVTCDTATQIEWLDLTETVGLSVNDFLGDALGLVSAGWMLATGGLVDQLMLGAGFTALDVTPRAEDLSAALDFRDLFGETRTLAGLGFAATDDPGLVARPFWEIVRPGGGVFLGQAGGSNQVLNEADPRNLRDPTVGIWTYRPAAVAVAEPAAFSLLILGLAGLAAFRRHLTA